VGNWIPWYRYNRKRVVLERQPINCSVTREQHIHTRAAIGGQDFEDHSIIATCMFTKINQEHTEMPQVVNLVSYQESLTVIGSNKVNHRIINSEVAIF
jgi:hypothetical protein